CGQNSRSRSLSWSSAQTAESFRLVPRQKSSSDGAMTQLNEWAPRQFPPRTRCDRRTTAGYSHVLKLKLCSCPSYCSTDTALGPQQCFDVDITCIQSILWKTHSRMSTGGTSW